MVKACIFDLDGTLLNTVYALSYCISFTMKEFGGREIDISHTKLFVGDGYKELVKRALIYSGDTELRNMDPACRLYMEIFNKNNLYKVKPYEGIIEAIKFLNGKQIKAAVLSNKPEEAARKNINEFFDEGLFERVYGQKEGIPRKPDPAMLNSLIQELEVNKDEILYFGDTSTDMLTANNAKVRAVGVLWGFRDRKELEAYSPYKIIEAPSDIKYLV